MARTLIISDIHGCINTLKTLVEGIGLSKSDHLIFLGDYIDRGPDSAGVIDFIMELQSMNYRITPLKGNHEYHFCRVYEEYDIETFRNFVCRINKSENLLDQDGQVIQKYLNWMRELPYYVESEKYVVVHGGLNLNIENPFDDEIAIVDMRINPDNGQEFYTHPFMKHRHLIYGHVPTPLIDIKQAIDDKLTLIPLDNGCIYNKPHRIFDYTKLGHLSCLDIDRWELSMQKNIDG
jgi:serine/threonine protein phosphatase 1